MSSTGAASSNRGADSAPSGATSHAAPQLQYSNEDLQRMNVRDLEQLQRSVPCLSEDWDRVTFALLSLQLRRWPSAALVQQTEEYLQHLGSEWTVDNYHRRSTLTLQLPRVKRRLKVQSASEACVPLRKGYEGLLRLFSGLENHDRNKFYVLCALRGMRADYLFELGMEAKRPIEAMEFLQGEEAAHPECALTKETVMALRRGDRLQFNDSAKLARCFQQEECNRGTLLGQSILELRSKSGDAASSGTEKKVEELLVELKNVYERVHKVVEEDWFGCDESTQNRIVGAVVGRSARALHDVGLFQEALDQALKGIEHVRRCIPAEGDHCASLNPVLVCPQWSPPSILLPYLLHFSLSLAFPSVCSCLSGPVCTCISFLF